MWGCFPLLKMEDFRCWSTHWSLNTPLDHSRTLTGNNKKTLLDYNFSQVLNPQKNILCRYLSCKFLHDLNLTCEVFRWVPTDRDPRATVGVGDMLNTLDILLSWSTWDIGNYYIEAIEYKLWRESFMPSAWNSLVPSWCALTAAHPESSPEHMRVFVSGGRKTVWGRKQWSPCEFSASRGQVKHLGGVMFDNGLRITLSVSAFVSTWYHTVAGSKLMGLEGVGWTDNCR